MPIELSNKNVSELTREELDKIHQVSIVTKLLAGNDENGIDRSIVYDIYKMIMPFGCMTKLAISHSYGGRRPSQNIYKICKEEGEKQRFNDDVLLEMRANIGIYIKNKNITIGNTADVLERA